ncbi:hypothetical protein PL329_16625 [Escherichia coli]|uniref:hypothetical protein n=1 Tax=Escherichia coli TaxID=562 RepID=UPI0023082C9B|nr:hypothetical protein [Escherichia coli]WCE52619.1 hypothetical protein PL329_16625 [Escherichia coli]
MMVLGAVCGLGVWPRLSGRRVWDFLQDIPLPVGAVMKNVMAITLEGETVLRVVICVIKDMWKLCVAGCCDWDFLHLYCPDKSDFND